MTLLPNAVKLKASPPPPGADGVYLQRYYAALANVWVSLAWVTPELARQWLDNHNTRNRPVSPYTTRQLRNKIAASLWTVNGETIVFGNDDTLLNGQHRLEAIAAGSHAVPVMVVLGVDAAAFATYDQGRRRSGADILALLDQENCGILAGAIAWAVRDLEDKMGNTGHERIPNEELAGWLDGYPDLPASAAWARSKRSTRLAPTPLLAYLHHKFTKHAPGHAEDFFDKVIDGVGVTRPSWQKSLRNQLEGTMSGRRSGADQIQIAALFIKGFGHVLTGKPCLMHKRGATEVEPAIYWKWDQGEPFPKLPPGPFAAEPRLETA